MVKWEVVVWAKITVFDVTNLRLNQLPVFSVLWYQNCELVISIGLKLDPETHPDVTLAHGGTNTYHPGHLLSELGLRHL